VAMARNVAAVYDDVLAKNKRTSNEPLAV
jgi:hypothetical protein